MDIAMRSIRRPVAALAVAGLLVAACGGGDDGDSTVDEGATTTIDEGDDDATLALIGAELVWAIDGQPIGDEFSYAEAIPRDRFEEGLRWEVRFDATGDVGDLDVGLARRITVNDDLVESGRGTLGPEAGVVYVSEPFAAAVEGDEVVLSVAVGRPLSAVSLNGLRRSFEEMTGLDADAEQVDLGNGTVMNVDVLLDLPQAPVGSINRYEYTARGSVTLGNGAEVEVNETIDLAVRDPRSFEVGLGGSCADLADVYLVHTEPQLAEPDLVQLDRVVAVDAVVREANARDCDPVVFRLAACNAARTLVEEGGGDVARSPWREAVSICPDGLQLAEATTVEASVADGVAQLVLPATVDGLGPLGLAMAVPTWEVTINPPRTNGQEVEFSAPGASGFRSAWFEIATSDAPATLVPERFVEAVTPGPDAGAEVARWSGEIDGARADVDGVNGEWFVSGGAAEYHFGAAIRLDDERLLRVRGTVTNDDGRAPTDDSVVELVSCLVEGAVIADWSVDADPLVPTTSCVGAGVFEPVAPTADEAVSDDAATDESATDDAGADEDVVADDEPPAGPAVVVPDGPPTYDAGAVVLPIQPMLDQPGAVITMTTPAWELEEIDAEPSGPGLRLVGPETGSSLTVDAPFASSPGTKIRDRLQPIGSDGTVLSDVGELVDGRDVRIVVSEYETLSDDLRRQVGFGLQLSDSRVLVVRAIVPADGALDAEGIVRNVLASLAIEI